MVKKDEEWMLPENLRRQEKAEIARVEGGEDASGGDFGSYYALLTRGNTDWVRRHAVIDESAAAGYARQAAEALGGLPRKPSLLDVGCGPGTITEALRAGLDYSQATGLDISESAVAYARERYPACRFEAAAIDGDTPLPEAYDVIHAREFYPFTRTAAIETHRRFLRLFAGHLKEGGALVIILADKPGSLQDTLGRLSGELAFWKLSPFRSVALASDALARLLPLPWARTLTRAGKAALRRTCAYLHVARREG